VHPQPQPLDDEDGEPVWCRASGQLLVPGVKAWRRLGVGHRNETWLGWSPTLWAPVVVKLPRPHHLDHPRARQSLSREVEALAGNLHPVLPRLYAWQLEGPCPYLLLEYVDGPALDEELTDHKALHPRSVALLGAQLLTALLPVHARGLAHLDIKPENVMIRDGRPVLVDFGSSRRLGSRQPAGHPVGTLGYAAPEMEACEPISPGMDIYGIGIVLREALGDRQRLRGRGARDRLFGLVAAMTNPDPDDRPDLAAALDWIAALDGRHRPWPGWVGSARPAAPLAEELVELAPSFG
jgi:serine/threonine protein kinase